jgi:hypothetical protein
MAGAVEAAGARERRDSRRRAGSRGGRRRGDTGLPWWRGGLAFAALCVALKGWRRMRRDSDQASRLR